MVHMNRVAGNPQQVPSAGACPLTHDILASVIGKWLERKSQVDGKRREDAHNGVRGDDVVVVTEAQSE